MSGLNEDELEGFRRHLRAWLEETLPAWWTTDPARADREARRAEVRAEWQRKVHAGGYAGLDWEVEYGGRGLDRRHVAVFLEETARCGAPIPLNLIGLTMVGPTIAKWGTAEQKSRFLPRMLDGTDVWCLGLSEPDAGSDLASLRTTAVNGSDGWVVTGQKVWTSYAHQARWGLVLARSSPADEGARGSFTCLIVDMETPGVLVRQLRDMTGDVVFNEVHLDGVAVPDEHVLGDPHEGWGVAMTTLGYERAILGLSFQAELQRQFETLVALVLRESDPHHQAGAADLRELARLKTEVEALRLTAYRYLLPLAPGEAPGPSGSMLKLRWSELNQRISEHAWDRLGPSGLTSETAEALPGGGRWGWEFLRSRANTIEAGTSEILRNTIAQRVLGLPRSAR